MKETELLKIVIGAVISSSVISALLTAFFNTRMHRLNYKRDYYKKILDKRLEAYSAMEQLITGLSGQANTGTRMTALFCFNYKSFEYFINNSVMNALSYSMWLNNDLSNKATELNIFLINNIENKIHNIVDNTEINLRCQELGSENWDEIRKFRKELSEIMRKDLKDLDNVKSFFKNRNKDKIKSFNVNPYE